MSASLETLDGVLSRINFHKPSKWNPAGTPYLIGRLTNGVTIKGEMRRPNEGERYRFWGETRPQKNRPDESAFEFTHYEVVIDQSVAGVARYLAEYVKGVGPAKAAAICEHFGDDALTILRTTPERVSEVEVVNEVVAKAVVDHFKGEVRIDPAAYAKLVEMFAEHRIPKKVMMDLLTNHGSNAPGYVKEHPYDLLAYPRIGWETADKFATQTCGYDVNGLDRHKAAIVEAVARITNDGHTYCGSVDIADGTHKLIGRTYRQEAMDSLAAEVKLVVVEPPAADSQGDTYYTTPELFAAERTVADRLAMLMEGGEPLPFSIDAGGLAGEQVDAVKIIERNAVAILAGAPGTGKSWTAAQVVKSLRSNGVKRIMFVAPTGKAAKRGAELLQAYVPGCGIEPSTIHRALGPMPSDAGEGIPSASSKVGRGRDKFGFVHNEGDPLETDFLIVDESSMVDVKLMADLLSAVAVGTRILFVGDQNQLPSVGPGSVLRDMMAAGVPAAYLTEIRRSTPGRVVTACHAIKDGRSPEPAKGIGLATGDNWVHIERKTPEEIAATIVELHKAGTTFKDLFWDFQVVSPQKGRLAFGCEGLNGKLSAKLNHFAAADQQCNGGQGAAPPFDVGDKVVRTKNGPVDELSSFDPSKGMRKDWSWEGIDYSISEGYVVNGDMGVVEDIVVHDKGAWVVVKLNTPDRLCRMSYNEANIIRAYAMTCHKCQGSGFPFVIIPVHSSVYSGLMTREWIYTALSRTEKLCVTVGEFSAIDAAVKRKTVHLRKTLLADMIRKSIPQEATA